MGDRLSEKRATPVEEEATVMEPRAKLLSVVIFLGLAIGFQGNAEDDYTPFSPYDSSGWECTPWDNITLITEETGELVNGTKQWRATFTNVCRCAQRGVILYADGFTSKEPIDPSILDFSDELAELNKGAGGLLPYETVSFTYAADEPFSFEGITCELDCPATAPAPSPSLPS